MTPRFRRAVVLIALATMLLAVLGGALGGALVH
ncbi:MAG: hypothetical protein QOF35_1265 [Actinomycetota bacterium]|jgi:hypothetical protein|nr:hypothetical protein [Actinomycetota bacterium]